MTTIRSALAAGFALLLLDRRRRSRPRPRRRRRRRDQGIWAVESMSFNGTRLPDDPTAGAKLTAFDGKDYVQRHGQAIVEEGTYEVDPSKTPAAIDFVIKKGPDAGKRQLGIYELEGNTLRVCAVRARFQEAAEVVRRRSGCLLVVNKRFRP